jgi:hypothetical protein
MAMNYDPSSYPQGVPNPYGARVHAWNGGPWNQGTRYHGSVWTRPDWRPQFLPRPISGLGAVQVDTRDGVFANEGYGGGLFNGNVGMSGAEYAQAAAGLGAADAGAVVLQKFTNVWLQMNGYCPISEDGVVGSKTCGALQVSGNLNNPEIVAECNRKGYTAPSRPPCAGAGPGASTGTNVQADQILANMWLTANGYCEINVDGTLGPKTCGAFQASGMNIPSGCTSFTPPSSEGCTKPVYTPPSDTPHDIPVSCQTGYSLVNGACVPVPGSECPAGQTLVNGICVGSSKGSTKAWMAVGGLLLAAIIGGAVYATQKGKKPMKANRRRRANGKRAQYTGEWTPREIETMRKRLGLPPGTSPQKVRDAAKSLRQSLRFR